MKYTKLLRRVDPSLKPRTGGDVAFHKMTQGGWQVRSVDQPDGEVVLEMTKHVAPDDCLRVRVRAVA